MVHMIIAVKTKTIHLTSVCPNDPDTQLFVLSVSAAVSRIRVITGDMRTLNADAESSQNNKRWGKES